MKSRLFHAVVALSASFGGSALALAACTNPGATEDPVTDPAPSSHTGPPGHGRGANPAVPAHRHGHGHGAADSSPAPPATDGALDEADPDEAAVDDVAAPPASDGEADAGVGVDATLDAGTSHPDAGAFDAGRDAFVHDAGWPPTK